MALIQQQPNTIMRPYLMMLYIHYLTILYSHYQEQKNHDIWPNLQSYLLADEVIRVHLIPNQEIFESLCQQFKDPTQLKDFLVNCLQYSNVSCFISDEKCIELLRRLEGENRKYVFTQALKQLSDLSLNAVIRGCTPENGLDKLLVLIPEAWLHAKIENNIDAWRNWVSLLSSRNREQHLASMQPLLAHHFLSQLGSCEKVQWTTSLRECIHQHIIDPVLLVTMLYQRIYVSVPPMDDANKKVHIARLFSALRMLDLNNPNQKACFSYIVASMVQTLQVIPQLESRFLEFNKKETVGDGNAMSFREFLLSKVTEEQHPAQVRAVLKVLSIVVAAQYAEGQNGAPYIQSHLQNKLKQALEPLDDKILAVFKNVLANKRENAWEFSKKSMIDTFTFRRSRADEPVTADYESDCDVAFLHR